MRKLAFLPLLFVVAACSGKVSIGANGSTQGSLKKNPDGSATGNGQTCSYGGSTVNVGQKFTSPDGCNTCTCAAEGAYCTEMACANDGGAAKGTCTVDGQTYQEGESWKCADGCNTCSCMEDGQVATTLMACAKNCSEPNACPGPQPGAPTILCADGTTGGAVCADNGSGQCGWTFRDCTCKDSTGKTHKPNESFSDGCNTCSCDNTGLMACTAMACQCPPPGTVIDCEPPVDQKPKCAGPEHDYIVANCPGVTFAL